MEDRSNTSLRDAGHEVLSVGLGLGILGYQRLQVKRREWERAHGGRSQSMATCLHHSGLALGELLTMANRIVRR